jgi:hypothetical protein
MGLYQITWLLNTKRNNTVKRQFVTWEEIFAIYSSHRELIPKYIKKTKK